MRQARKALAAPSPRPFPAQPDQYIERYSSEPGCKGADRLTLHSLRTTPASADTPSRSYRRLSVQVEATETSTLLDPDFREVGASGRLWSRAEMIRELPSDTADEDDAITVTDMHGVRLSGEIVLVTYISERCGRRARRSSLWRRSDRTWRVLYHQGTIVDGA